MPGLRASARGLAAPLLALFWSAAALAQSPPPSLDPSVAGYDESPCLDPKSSVTLHGANFGPGGGLRMAAQTPGGFVTLRAVEWSDTKIIAQLPDDSRLQPGHTYVLGVALDGADAFLSNPVTAAVCGPVPALAPMSQSAPAKEEEDDGDVSFGLGIGLGVGGLFGGGGGGDSGGGKVGGGQKGGQGGGYRQPGGGSPGSNVGGGVGVGVGIPIPIPSGSDSGKSGASGNVVLAAAPPAPPATNGNYEPGEILALFDTGDAADAFIPAAGGLGYTLIRRDELADLGFVLLVLQVPGGTTVAAGTAALRAAFPAAIIDANHFYALQQGGGRYGLSLLGWNKSSPSCGAGLRVGVLDTGVDTAHPALAGRKIEVQNFVNLKDGETPADPGHGTAVSAIIVGDPAQPDFTGVVPGAELYFGGIFKISGLRGQVASTEAIMRGLNWLAGKKVAVVNLSFAGPENAGLKAVVHASVASGRILIAAAGNGGPTAPPAYPAAQEGVIAATAVDANLGIYAYANQGSYVTFAAPGVDLYLAAPGGGGVQESGTSFAAPYVTAAMAEWLLAGNAGDAAVQKMVSTSKDLGAPGRDSVFGWGLVQLANVCAAK